MATRFKKYSTSTTTTLAQQTQVEVKFKLLKPAIVFFIGGAGDKEAYYTQGPFGNISDVLRAFAPRVKDLFTQQLYQPHYIGYNEAKGENDIKRNIVSKIQAASDPIHIVGHSLGGWNGAHLSSVLTSMGYIVDTLITLDPVGEGTGVALASDIYFTTPKPQAGFWINICAEPKSVDGTDVIAMLGQRWRPEEGPDIYHVADVNHWNAKRMFTLPLINNMSAADYLNGRIRHSLLR